MRSMARTMGTWALGAFLLAAWSTTASARVWTDAQGNKIDAELIGVKDGKAQLKSNEGDKIYAVPLERLSDADRQHIAEAAGLKLGGPAKPAEDAAATEPVPADGDDRFSAAIRANPNNPEAYYDRGRAFFNRGEYDEALKDFSKAIELDPKHAHAFDARGQVHAAMKDPVAAARDYDSAIAADPKLSIAYRHRGENLKELAKTEEGKKVLEEKVEAYRKTFQAARDRQLSDKAWQPLNSTSGPSTRMAVAARMAQMDRQRAYYLEGRYVIGRGYGVGGGGGGGGSGYGSGSGSGSGYGKSPMAQSMADGLTVSPPVVEQGAAITLTADPAKLTQAMAGAKGAKSAYGKKNQPQYPESVDFYRDADRDGILDKSRDHLLGTDDNGKDGFSTTVSTSGYPLGKQKYFALPKGASPDKAIAATASSRPKYGKAKPAPEGAALAGNGEVILPPNRVAAAGGGGGGGGGGGYGEPKAARAVERALGYVDRGDYRKAITQYDDLLEEYVDDPYYLKGRAQAYVSTGSYDYAIRDYDRAVAVQPTAEIHYNRGCAHLAAGNVEQAIADFTASLKLDELGKFANLAHNNRGAAYARQGRFEMAVTDFDAAIRVNSADPVAYRNRGQALKKIGKNAEAEADFAKAAQLGG